MPKIVSKRLIKPQTFDEKCAGELFDKIEGFAGYGFNLSHSVEYALISYQSMWLKTYYPVEFYAAALTLMDEDKLPGLIADAGKFGVELQMPNVNNSTHRFEILNDTTLSIPFSRVKGLTEKTALEIVAERNKGGKFKSKDDFEARVRGRTVHSGKIEALNRVGAFAGVEPAQEAANSPGRILAQRELIPGLISANVPVNRDMNTDKPTKVELLKVIAEYRSAHGPGGDSDGVPVSTVMGKTARMMVIFDAPNKQEEESGKMTATQSFGPVSDALAASGLSRNDGYFTALIKRPKEGKQVSAEEISKYGKYLLKEIELLKPPVIVMLGSQTVRYFYPDFKGKASDFAGKVMYNKDLDANMVVGFSPGELYYAPEKQVDLNHVFEVAANLTS